MLVNTKTKQSEPINIVATDKIMCINCEKYYHHSEIEQHMMTHTSNKSNNIPNMLIINTTQFGNGLIDFSKFKTRDSHYFSQTDSNSDDIRTMRYQELPLPQSKKKQIKLVQPPNNFPSKTIFKPKPNYTVIVQPLNLVDNINMKTQNLRQHISVGDYFVPIEMSNKSKHISITSSALNLQKNMNLASFIDNNNNILLPKVQRLNPQVQEQLPKNIQYSRITSTPSKISFTNSPSKIFQSSQKTTIKVTDNNILLTNTPSNIIKNTKSNLKTVKTDLPSTINKSSRFTENQKQHKRKKSIMNIICGYPEQILNNQPEASIVLNNDYNTRGRGCKCRTCGGFYCPECKSTIPPQFRRCPPYLLNLQNRQSQRQQSNKSNPNIFVSTPIKHLND